MGAFENAIREQETFESLLKLYKESRDQVAELERENEELWESAKKAAELAEPLSVSVDPIPMQPGRYSVTRDRLAALLRHVMDDENIL